MAHFGRKLTLCVSFIFRTLLEHVFGTWNGKAGLVTVFPLLVEELRQRIGQRFVEMDAVAEDVDGCVYGVPHRTFIGFSLSGNVVGCAVVRRGADDRKSSRVVYARPWSWYIASTPSKRL